MRSHTRRLALVALLLTLTSCTSGRQPMQAPSMTRPNISVPQAQLQEPKALPQPRSSSDVDLLTNHVDVAHSYHDLAEQTAALVCGLLSQSGFTVNGADPIAPQWCSKYAADTRVTH